MLDGDMKDPATVAARLREIATYLDAEEDNYRARAYQKAANAIESAALFPRLVAEGRLQELPGIGASLAAVIQQWRRGDATPCSRSSARALAAGAHGADALPGVGVKEARVLFDALGVTSLDERAQAGSEGACVTSRGSASRPRRRSSGHRRGPDPDAKRLVWTEAAELARVLRGALRDTRSGEVVVAGEVRRGIEVSDRSRSPWPPRTPGPS